ncbi:hypothetical protein [Alkalihalobacterium elongatum]|uniref:hypothetical protein n=1 Tax=Alkalihalobacterium elongatum TaxID=2675466 RepID=UPI001C1F8A1F|nr:hypothetical protein [Alkalihalobacterium elongatum]
MSERKPRLALTGAIIILSFSIYFSALSISSAIRDSSNSNVNQGSYEYELGRFNNNFEEYIRIMEDNRNN